MCLKQLPKIELNLIKGQFSTLFNQKEVTADELKFIGLALQHLDVNLPQLNGRVDLAFIAELLKLPATEIPKQNYRANNTRLEHIPLCEENCSCKKAYHLNQMQGEITEFISSLKYIELQTIEPNKAQNTLNISILVDIKHQDPIESLEVATVEEAKRLLKRSDTLAQKSHTKADAMKSKGSSLNFETFNKLQKDAEALLALMNPGNYLRVVVCLPNNTPEDRLAFMEKYRQRELFPIQLLLLNTPEVLINLRRLTDRVNTAKKDPLCLYGLMPKTELTNRIRLGFRDTVLPSGNITYTVNQRGLKLSDSTTEKSKQAYINNLTPGTPQLDKTLEDPLLIESWQEDVDYDGTPNSELYYFITYAYSFNYTESYSGQTRTLIKVGHTQIRKQKYHTNIDDLIKVIKQRFTYLSKLGGEYDTKAISLFNHACFNYSKYAKNLELQLLQETKDYDYYLISPEEFTSTKTVRSELRSKDTLISINQIIDQAKTYENEISGLIVQQLNHQQGDD
ncbi:hypothetical protein [Shewanella sp. 10N.286.52.B9]|uniref:hypothetical protein n=1 Tax=Shewanella sp. 10N.286.52.B9 TaxID=1880837 RepID=UPI000C85F958|nr:hypothetical protein [Shewanella sp. 10N.286.52.B9]PMG42167.1 hypothetical protein BCU91_08590 [Shewanella sp. 10N.286.52.B9]